VGAEVILMGVALDEFVPMIPFPGQGELWINC